MRPLANRPLAVDLYTGLHGWAEGLIAAGFHVVGFDLEDMSALLGEAKPEHFSLVIQDVLTVHGAQLKDAALIVGSSPCQDFSYRAMPWTRARKLTGPFGGLWLFHAQFRIQREASEAAGRHIPMVVENVRGAIPWVGRSRANFGSYHLWGDVPALMPTPSTRNAGGWGGVRSKTHDGEQWNVNRANFTGTLGWNEDAGRKIPGFRFDGSGGSFQSAAVAEAIKAPNGTQWFNDGPRTPDSLASSGSKSPRRKAASARIAKIPFSLAYWVGRYWHPEPFGEIEP